MNLKNQLSILTLLPFLLGPLFAQSSLKHRASPPERDPQSLVILVTIDGLRVEEILGGMDADLCNRERGGVSNPAALRARYDAKSPEDRRKKLMPFFWKVLVPKGQLFGDRSLQSPARLLNTRRFSYPGYGELLQGFVDPWIDSNKKRWNRNKTVLEHLGHLTAFQGSIVGFGSWDVLPYVVNTQRSKLPINAGLVPLVPTFKRLSGRKKAPKTLLLLDKLQKELCPVLGKGERMDAFSFYGAFEVLKTCQVRILWLGLGDTDEWAHHKRYDFYLDQIHKADDYLRRLWEFCQRDSRYRGRCSLLVTCDHGRGRGSQWISHGPKIQGAENVWIALLGRKVPARGVRKNRPATLSQVAPTLAFLLGYDLRVFEPRASLPLDLR